MDIINELISKNKETFCPFWYERQMDFLFDKLSVDFEGKSNNVIDVCCGMVG